MPLRTFLAEKALWLRLLFCNYLGLKRAFMGTPQPLRREPELILLCLKPRIKDLKNLNMKVIPNFTAHLEHLEQLGVALGQLLQETEPPEQQGQSHLSRLLVQCSLPLSVISLQPPGLKQLRHQKCHITYDNTVSYITDAAEQARGRSPEREPQRPASGSQAT